MNNNPYIEQLQQIKEDAERRYKEYNEIQRKADLQITDITHCIEFGKCDAVTCSKLVKAMKQALQDRREAKNHIPALQSIITRLNAIDKASVSKNYHIRTDVLKDIIGKAKGQQLCDICLPK